MSDLRLEGLPRSGRPLDSYGVDEVEAELARIAREIADAALEVSATPLPSSKSSTTEVASPELDDDVEASFESSSVPEPAIEEPSSLVVFPYDEEPPAPRTFLSAYAADDSRGEDLLGITKDVHACASLIAARTVAPPLSIGLFGDWGSGKTFFMRQLRRRVDKIAREARESGWMQKDIAYYKRIVQIEFNAWHYVEGNLWASLVEHIFDNLRIGDDRSTVATLQKHFLEKLQFEKAAREDASAREKTASQNLEQAGIDLQAALEEYDRKALELAELSKENILLDLKLPTVKAQIDQTLKDLGLGEVRDSVRDLRQALAEAQAVAERGVGILTPLIKAPDKNRRFVVLVVILVVAPLVGLAAEPLLRWISPQLPAQLGAVATSMAALLSLGAGWIRSQAAWMSDKVGRLEAARGELDKQVEEAQAENRGRITDLRQQLEILKAEHSAAQRKREEAERRVADAQAELEQANAGWLLAKFIQDRAESSDYRKHLGVLALVRDDFETLSGLIEEENWRLAPASPNDGDLRHTHPKYATLEEEDAERETRINRIVLYIDDLDRCPPKKVVEVLQAVHLLLAFPLFVVVVGVDARWVARSLQKHYPDLLQDGQGKGGRAAATPDDYLEKIFQIPFWLRPMKDESCLQMVQGLLAPSLEKKASDPMPKVDNSGRAPLPAPPSPDTESEGATLPAAAAPPPPMEADGAPPGDELSDALGREPEEIDLAPCSLVISETEAKFIKLLAPLLGRSPRALKRFVNVYQLIKAGLSEEEQATFLEERTGETADYQAVLFLLSVVTGVPEVAPDLWRVLRQAGRDYLLSDSDLRWVMDEMDTAMGNDPGWRKVSSWLLPPAQSQLRLDKELKPLIHWEPEVSRYSFRVAPEAHPPNSPPLQPSFPS